MRQPDKSSCFEAVKIKSFRLPRARGAMMTLPKVWIDDLGLSAGDQIDVYRDAQDRLIVTAARSARSDEPPVGAGREARR